MLLIWSVKAVRLLFKKIVDSKKDVKAELLRIYIVCIVDCPMGSCQWFVHVWVYRVAIPREVCASETP